MNPHFLYNTLDMIKWMARKGMADEIEELLNSLATFYRLSLSEGRETIPIRDELRHVELYTRIQNIRFRGAIGFCRQRCWIAKIPSPGSRCQPLVENSILHGIKSDKRGMIRITGGAEDGSVILVEDDGVGIEDGALRRFWNRPGREPVTGCATSTCAIACMASGCGLSFQSRRRH